MGQKDAITGLVLLVVVTAGLTAGLHRLGDVVELRINWADPAGWFNNASPEAAIGATLRSVGLVIGYWIIFSTALYVLATLRSRTRRPRLVNLMTLPGIRRVVDRALATALAASIAASPLSPALAEQPPPPPVVFDINADGIPVPHLRMNQPEEAMPNVTTEQETKVVIKLLPPPIVVPVTTSAQPMSATVTAIGYTVQAGDSLWLIADEHVHAKSDSEATLALITSYWRRVVAANRNTLRSGDPNLIFPGEIVVLPTLEVTP